MRTVASSFKLLYVPSSTYITAGGITYFENAALAEKKADIVHHVSHEGGGLLVLSQVRIAEQAGRGGTAPIACTDSFCLFFSSASIG
jgi:hypothetical protein